MLFPPELLPLLFVHGQVGEIRIVLPADEVAIHLGFPPVYDFDQLLLLGLLKKGGHFPQILVLSIRPFFLYLHLLHQDRSLRFQHIFLNGFLKGRFHLFLELRMTFRAESDDGNPLKIQLFIHPFCLIDAVYIFLVGTQHQFGPVDPLEGAFVPKLT